MLMDLLIYVACLAIFFRQTATTELSCQVFREQYYTAEYGEQCYVYVDHSVTWYKARDGCLTLGGHLARLKNSDEYKHVLNADSYFKIGKRFPYGDMFVWIDGRRINGELRWTNGQLMTFSKPNIWGNPLSLSQPLCLLVSKENSDKRYCDYTAAYICEKDKQPTPYEEMTSTTEPTTTDSPSTAETISQPGNDKARQEMTFLDVKYLHGVSKPKLKLEAENTVITKNLMHCAVHCTSLRVCQLFNFHKKTKKCRIYSDADGTLKAGAESVNGWKVYRRHGVYD